MVDRHSDESLLRYITQSCRAYRAMLSRAGWDGFIEPTTPAALPTTAPTTGELFLEVDWPATAVSIHGFDVLLGGTRWYPLKPVSFAERRDYTTRGGPPRAYVIRTLPKTTPSTTGLSAGKLMVFPLDASGMTYRIWYLPEFPTITNASQFIEGFDGDALEWMLWDSVIKVAAKDDDAQNVDQIAVRERAVLQERITTNINRVDRSGSLSPRRAGYRGR